MDQKAFLKAALHSNYLSSPFPLHHANAEICMVEHIKDDSEELALLKKRVAELELSEKRLQASNEYLQLLYESVPLCYQSLDENGYILEVNQVWLDTLGYSREEVIGLHFSELLLQDWRAHFKENFRRFKAIGEVLGVEFEMLKKNGSRITVSFHGKIRTTPEGHFQQTYCIFQDITRRRHAEEVLQERQHTLQALQESEERFRNLFDFAPIAYQSLDQNGRYTFINNELCKLLGYEKDEIIGQSFAAFFQDEYVGLFPERFSCFLKEGNIENELPLLRKDGRKITVILRGTVQKDHTGKFVQTHCILFDITERKRMEEELRESRERYQSLFENAGDAILVHEADGGKFIDVNSIACQRLGYTREEFLEMTLRDLGTPRQAALAGHRIQRVQEHGHHTFESEHKHKRGWILPVEVVSHKINYSGKEVFLSIARDLSEREQAQKALRESEKRFRSIFMDSPVALFELDCSRLKLSIETLLAHGINDIGSYLTAHLEVAKRLTEDILIIEVNPEAHKLFETDQSTRHFSVLASLFNEESYGSFIKAVDRMARGMSSFSQTMILKTEKNTRLITQLKVSVIPGCEDSWEKVLAAVVDVTKLQEARRQADAANMAKSTFLASMSHDLRTPINGVMGMLQLLQADSLKNEQLQYVNVAVKSCQKLSQLLGDILDFSKIEAGKLDIVHLPFNLQQVLQGVIDLFLLNAQQKGLNLSFHIAPDIPEDLIGDHHRLAQILANLVGNALKFTEKGKVEIEVMMARTQENTLQLVFIVSDSGVGISDAAFGTLFDSFSQIECEIPQQGVGLGLAIVKRLVHLMGGEICVTSEKSLGTAFYVNLAFDLQHNVEPSVIEKVSISNALESSSLHVLVVEDDGVNILVLTKLLKTLGCHVDVAETGHSALKAIADKHFDIVFMDIQLPDISGVEITQTVRTSAKFKSRADMYIVALTACAMAGDKERFLEAGMDDYLAKPVDVKQLRALLKKVLSQIM